MLPTTMAAAMIKTKSETFIVSAAQERRGSGVDFVRIRLMFAADAETHVDARDEPRVRE